MSNASVDNDKKYGVIYADPPWKFATYSDKGKGRSAEAWYDCLSIDEIKALYVQSLAANDCVLLMWVTDPFLEQGFEVVRSWGFVPKTVGFYWAKCSNNYTNGLTDEDWCIGTGYWTRANPEQCLLATRGNPRAISHSVRKLIVSPRREHSRKPDEAYDRIEALCEGPYVELFARYKREGWDTALSTLEGSVNRRWKSNSSPTGDDEPSTMPIDIHAYLLDDDPK